MLFIVKQCRINYNKQHAMLSVGILWLHNNAGPEFLLHAENSLASQQCSATLCCMLIIKSPQLDE